MRECQWNGCGEEARYRVRLHAADGYQGFMDLCLGHRQEFLAECQRLDPGTTETVAGRAKIDEDGNVLSKETAH